MSPCACVCRVLVLAVGIGLVSVSWEEQLWRYSKVCSVLVFVLYSAVPCRTRMCLVGALRVGYDAVLGGCTVLLWCIRVYLLVPCRNRNRNRKTTTHHSNNTNTRAHGHRQRQTCALLYLVTCFLSLLKPSRVGYIMTKYKHPATS